MAKEPLEDTKDYTELNEEKENEIIEDKQIEEVPEEKDLENEFNRIMNTKRKIILVSVIIVLVIAIIFCALVILNNKSRNTIEIVDDAIQRPAKDKDYIVIKNNVFNLQCKKTKTGTKIKKLEKNMIIECNFNYQLFSNQSVKKLYFDLNTSSNIKLSSIDNKSSFTVQNYNNTYLFTAKKPTNVSKDEIKLYFEVLNNEPSAYVELNDIIFIDSNKKYYKVQDDIETFPPEYDDKIYIYKSISDDSSFYYSSKAKTNNKEDTLIETYECNKETCDVQAQAEKYFLIYDDKLLLYDLDKKITHTIKIPENFNIEDYTFDITLNMKNQIYGILFKKDYVSAFDCNNDEICINTSMSGFEIAYYSIRQDMFTIDLDNGYIGSNIYNNYDIALMLKKDNQFAIYSYEDDNMMMELTDKYKSMEYDDYTHAVALEVYDKENNEYYFEYFDPLYSQFKLDTDNLVKFEDSSIYYNEAYNSKSHTVVMLFDNKGYSLTNLPYALKKDIIKVSDKITIMKNNVYYVYDLLGNLLYKSAYKEDEILTITSSYLVIKHDNRIFVTDKTSGNEKDIINIKDGISYVSSKEEEGILTIFIKDTKLQEDDKNGYKYTVEGNNPLKVETIKLD